MGSAGEVHIRRGGDRSLRRRPLRIEIGRRRARTPVGAEKYVTEVRFGDATAVVVPWRPRPS
jgi:hypothetical protein